MVATKTRRTQPTEHAQAAKQIRAALKAAYPKIAFRVTSKSYSGGSSVTVHWTDGPTSHAVDAVLQPFEYGSFDGSQDLYEYTNVRDDLPQVRYAHASRSQSPEARQAIIDAINARFGWALRDHPRGGIDGETDAFTGNGYRSDEINRAFWNLSLVCPACGSPTLPGDRFCPDCGASLPAEDR